MRDLDAFLDRALDGREPEDGPDPVLVEPVPVLDRLPRVARVPVPRVPSWEAGTRADTPTLEHRRTQLRVLLASVPRNGGIYTLRDFTEGKLWSAVRRWLGDGRVAWAAARLMRDEELAQDWADIFGVPVRRFKVWRDAVLCRYAFPTDTLYDDVALCRGTTRSGKLCSRRIAMRGRDWQHPGDFRPGITDRCPQHKEHADVAP